MEGRPSQLCLGTAAHYGLEQERGEDGAELIRGISVFSVPIGDDKFVEAFVLDKAQGIAGNIQKTISMLSPGAYHHHLWSVLRCSLSKRFDFWLRNCHPDQVLEAAELIDASILDAAAIALGIDVRKDDIDEGEILSIAQRRMRLPARNMGGGLRPAAKTRDAAYVGALAATLPSLLPSLDAVAVQHAGDGGVGAGAVHLCGLRVAAC